MDYFYVMNSHDLAYKGFFAHKEMVISLLQSFVPKNFVKELDFSTLRRRSGSYITDDMRERMDDCVWEVKFGGKTCYLYLLMEFQSTPDPWMPVRILTYTGLLLQDVLKSRNKAKNAPLPPVFPIVLYNGRRKWRAPLSIEEMQGDVPEELRQYQPRQSYFLLDEKKCEVTGSGLMDYLVRIEQADMPQETFAFIGMLKKELRKAENDDLARKFVLWLNQMVLIPAGIATESDELNNMEEVEAMISETAAKWPEMFRAEGREEGRMKALSENIRSLMATLGLSLEKAMEVLNVTPEDRKKLASML